MGGPLNPLDITGSKYLREALMQRYPDLGRGSLKLSAPHHAEAPRCKLLVMNRNFADGLLEKRSRSILEAIIDIF
jgi:hypothetical protein